ncbi:hypothetical protein MJG53_012347 [Ovis ammon polii x Ovis aries]|uniref:Uncharacterized protein n=1 Tax=Ovis ammon polii x Ovis aries TaxID=2918886 RepID=A0ACB9UNB5_9CETA|nr:hypothetical protein MJT46_011974 [Ovis ammon polii x Ovis aries]KAI4574171.1 hypothetical protein MJG53_012347 [Ovis ammon polii x Ovis aries]
MQAQSFRPLLPCSLRYFPGARRLVPFVVGSAHQTQSASCTCSRLSRVSACEDPGRASCGEDRYSSGANGDTFNRTLASSSDPGESNKRENTSTVGGFGVGKSFGNRGFSNNKFEEGDSSGFWRGYQDGNDSEASGSSRRGGRGSFRGCRGGFGLGSPNSNYEQDEGTQRSGGIFGSRRSALSGADNGDTFQSRSGSGSGRGGYKGLNEEVITGSGKNSWKSEAEGGESGDTQGPKVTYIPPPPPEDEDSIFAHYQTGINFDKYDTILVEVSGHDPPPAILTFEEANLCQTLNNNIAKAGYTKLTPVQKYSIPIIQGGRDLMACAQTGSGKTAAFLLPILAHMMRDGITASRFKELQEPECIIVAPTRELINQIYLEARKFSFGQVKYLVLDEADRMLDMGFGPEMKKLISCPGMPSKEQRQTLMFSATFPEEIQRLAGEFLKSNYLFVAVGQVGGACRDVQQTILQVGQYSKREKLVEILRNIGDERTMVFVETKKKADFIATFLCQEKISTTSIHGLPALFGNNVGLDTVVAPSTLQIWPGRCYLRENDTCISTSENGSSCSFYSRLTPPDIYIIQVEAENAYGIIKSDITYWDLYTVAKIEPPKIFSVKPVLGLKQMVQVKWTQPVLAPKSSTLNYTLRFRSVNSTHWKAKGTPVLEKVLGYNIWYFPENNTNLTKTMNTTNQQPELYLGNQTYWIHVISYNSLGKSPEATLRIPAIDEKSFQCIEAMHTSLTQDQLVVEWQSSALEVDTWMVEWVPDLDSKPLAISWESVSHTRNWTIQQDELKPFWCYNISVYPMLQNRVGEPYSIQAYVKEGVPSEGPKTKVENIGVRTVTITWKEIPKHQRNGFINNYTIFYQAEDGKEFSKTVNSSILQYDLEFLTRKTSYTVWVKASTSAGGVDGPRINFKTLSISVFEIFLVTSLVGGGLLILIILTVAYGIKKPNKLKHLCWPDVPNPAESSIATWCGDDFKGKLNLKEFDDSVNREDGILKPCYSPNDLIDKLVVNFESFLEVVSTEDPGKSQPGLRRKPSLSSDLIPPRGSISNSFQLLKLPGVSPHCSPHISRLLLVDLPFEPHRSQGLSP